MSFTLPPLRTIVASNVRAEMARQLYTSRDLADALGISQSAASRRMTGTTEFSFADLERTATWLEVELADLLGTGSPEAAR